MKKIIIALIALVGFASCAEETLNDKVEAVVEEYMENSYGTFYRSLDFGEKIDSVYNDYFDNIEFKSLLQSHKDAKAEFDFYYATQNTIGMNVCVDAMKEYGRKMDSIRENFVPEFIGYKIQHRYEKYGKEEIKFFLVNPELRRVTKEGI